MESQRKCGNCGVISNTDEKNIKREVFFKKGEMFTGGGVRTVNRSGFFFDKIYDIHTKITYEILEDLEGLCFTCPICKDEYAITETNKNLLMNEGKLRVRVVDNESFVTNEVSI